MFFFFKLNRKILKARELYGNWMIWRFKAEMSWLPKSSESLTIRRSSRIFPTEENVPTVRYFLFFFHAFFFVFFFKKKRWTHSVWKWWLHLLVVVMQILCKWGDFTKEFKFNSFKIKTKNKSRKWKVNFRLFFLFGWQRSATKLKKNWPNAIGTLAWVRWRCGTCPRDFRSPTHTHTHTHTGHWTAIKILSVSTGALSLN